MISKIFILFIRFYQRWLSPLMPMRCRFYPTCSEYAVDAITQYGWLNGSFVAFKRIIKCHPFHPGGIDIIGVSHD